MAPRRQKMVDKKLKKQVEMMRKHLDEQRHNRPLPFPPGRSNMWDPIIIEISGSENRRDEDESSNRAGKLDWCTCHRCIIMPTHTESICCREIDQISPLREGIHECVCDGDYVNNYLHNRRNLQYLHLYSYGYKLLHLKNVEDLIERDYRRIAYRAFTMVVHGFLGPKNRRPIPACVVHTIRSAYPAPDHMYTGFHYADNDGPAYEMFYE